MPVGIPWDELPRPHRPDHSIGSNTSSPDPSDVENEYIVEAERDFRKDAESIGRRVAFGVLVCSDYRSNFSS